MNALDLLKEDHEKVKKMLTELCETTTRAVKKRSLLLDKISRELRLHTKIEEDIFYPAFREAGNKQAEKMFYEALEEHRAVEALVLPDLEKTPAESEKFSGRAKVLKELIEHHADEEESEMFPLSKKLFDDAKLEELGKRMKEAKSASI